MRRILGSVAAVLAAVGCAAAVQSAQPAVAAQQQGAQAQCLHGSDETDVQKDRRAAAIAHMRTITNAQFRVARQGTKSFVSLDQLGVVNPPPSGFDVQLVASQTTFLLSVKDTRDPCKFAVFTDQAGLFYVGQPLQ